ncbi:MAG: tetratricopeptide repeat protein, partial [Ktedonobacteraceae bacterium]
VYAYTNRLTQAFEDYNAALWLNPHSAATYHNRGCCYLRTLELERAVSDLRASWELQPDVSTGLILGWLKLALNDGLEDEEIARGLEELATHDPRHIESPVCLGIAFYLRGDYEQALAQLALAETAGPENENVYFWQGMLLAALERPVEAELAFMRTQSLNLPQILWRPAARVRRYTEIYNA